MRTVEQTWNDRDFRAFAARLLVTEAKNPGKIPELLAELDPVTKVEYLLALKR
jgi:hypothetical protein